MELSIGSEAKGELEMMNEQERRRIEKQIRAEDSFTYQASLLGQENLLILKSRNHPSFKKKRYIGNFYIVDYPRSNTVKLYEFPESVNRKLKK
jgi:hypothetical protein